MKPQLSSPDARPRAHAMGRHGFTPRRLSTWAASLAALILAAGHASAQTAAVDPATLAKYDVNHNGRLDPEERAAMRAASDSARTDAAISGTSVAEEPVQMSPFEVVENTRGYLAANAMSGTRVNTKLEDIASSITVVTKQQMSDFALLDINDVFAYEAGTEGSGTFTDVSFNQSAQPTDGNQVNPNTANRVRGLNAANIAYGGFETSRRVPVDPVTNDGVEISRGPNSILFGLGNASGTANGIPVYANTRRDFTQIQGRVETYGRLNGELGKRESIDINRVILKNKLAVRVSQVFQDPAYTRQPAGVRTERYNGMIKYQPFKGTTINAVYQTFHQYGVRPNSITPRDAVTPWIQNGSPTWDPLTNTAYINGSPVTKAGVATTALGGGIPTINGAAVFNSAYQTTGRGSSLLYIDQGGVAYWTAPRGTTSQDALLKTSATNNQTGFNYMLISPQTLRRVQPLWSSDAAVSNKAIYDWSTINAASMNYLDEKVNTSLVTVDQVFFDTRRQSLVGQIGWYREDSPKYFHDFPTGSSGSTYLYVDVNQRRLDGTPNPFYLRPYFGMTETNVIDSPLTNDTYRAQLAYKLDFTGEKNWVKWLGLHNLTGFGEYKHNVLRSYYAQLAMLDDHSWLPAGTPRSNSSALPSDTLPQDQASPTGSRSYRFYFVGDNQGNNIDYAPYAGPLAGTYNYTWGNFAAKQTVNEPTQLGLAASVNGTAGAQNSLKIQKTEGGVLQSHFLNDHLVTTVGLRKDKVYTKAGVPARLLPDGKSHDYEWDQQWASGDYKGNHGLTRTEGAVLKVTNWLSVHANKSNSFIPADPAINLHGKFLPNPQGKGEDYGFSLNLFHNKLNIRAIQYRILTKDDRNGSSSTLATRTVKMDVFDSQPSRAFALDLRTRQWLQSTQGLNGAALDAAVAKEMQMDPTLLATLENSVNFGGLPIAQGQDALSKGKEIEINYNPTSYWTLKANVSQTETIQSAVAQDLLDYINERMPVWTALKDRETGLNWYTENYNGIQAPQAYLQGQVLTALGIQQQTVGKSLPQIRKYHANLATNLYLRGLTDNRWLRNFNVGGAIRWEDKGGIGYYGVQQLPDIITDLDRNRPIWDKANYYVDLLAGYRTKLFANKVGMSVQLNIRNVTEGGRLQAVSAYPDGTPNAYRIVDPRQFILTVTFDL